MEEMSIQKTEKFDMRVSKIWMELLKVKTEQSKFSTKSKYVRWAVEFIDDLIDGYSQLNYLFTDLSILSDELVSNMDGFADLIRKHLNIPKLKNINKELSIE